MDRNDFTLYTSQNGKYRVAALMADGRKVITDPAKYSSEATATLAAIKHHNDKPFINYVVVRSGE